MRRVARLSQSLFTRTSIPFPCVNRRLLCLRAVVSEPPKSTAWMESEDKNFDLFMDMKDSFKNQQYNKVIRLYSEESKKKPLTYPFISMALRSLCMLHKDFNVAKLCDALIARNIRISSSDIHFAFFRICNVANYEEKCTFFFNELKNRTDFSIKISHYNAMMGSLLRKDISTPEEAEKINQDVSALFDELLARNLIPNRSSYACIIGSQSRLANNSATVSKFVSEFRADGYEMDEIIYARVASAFSNSGQWDMARSTIEEMLSAGFHPSVNFFNLWMQSVACHGNWEECLEIFEYLKKNGHTPMPHTFKILLSVLSKSHQTEKMVYVLNHMNPRENVFLRNEMFTFVEAQASLEEITFIYNQLKYLCPGFFLDSGFCKVLGYFGKIDEAIEIAITRTGNEVAVMKNFTHGMKSKGDFTVMPRVWEFLKQLGTKVTKYDARKFGSIVIRADYNLVFDVCQALEAFDTKPILNDLKYARREMIAEKKTEQVKQLTTLIGDSLRYLRD